jgi:hypothetical protein
MRLVIFFADYFVVASGAFVAVVPVDVGAGAVVLA